MYCTIYSSRGGRGIRKPADPVTRFVPLQDFPNSIRTRYLIRYSPVFSVKSEKLTFHISYILSSQRLFAGHTGRKKSVKYEPKTSDLPFSEPTRGSAPFFQTKIMCCGHFGSKNKKIMKNPCPPLVLKL